MKRLLLFLLLLSALSANAQNTPAYNAEMLMKRVSNTDTIYIVNFWATWCPPCVEELPNFDTLQEKYAGKPVKVLLVSFDFKEDVAAGKLAAFISAKHLQPEVISFTETDANKFIPEIDKDWSGALPGTMIVQQSKSFKKFMEGTITVPLVSAVVDKQLAR